MYKRESLPLLFAHSLFFKEPLEQFAHVTHYKRAAVSDSLRSLMTTGDGSNLLFFMSESLSRSQKTSESLEKPMSEFPTLNY